MSRPRLTRIVAATPAWRRRDSNASARSVLEACRRRILAGVERDQIDVAQPTAQQPGQVVGERVGVVDAGHQRVLEADPTAGQLDIIVGRVEDLGDRPAAVDRHQARPQLVVRRVQRDGQPDLQALVGQPPHLRHQTRRRQRDAAGAQPQPVRVHQQPDRAQRLVVVGQRLAHAHEHDVGHRSRRAAEAQHLLDDLARLEIAGEAELAGDAEDAAHRAAGLRRDADRLAARPSSGRVHLDGFDLLAIVQAQQQLGGQAVDATAAAAPPGCSPSCEALAQRGAAGRSSRAGRARRGGARSERSGARDTRARPSQRRAAPARLETTRAASAGSVRTRAGTMPVLRRCRRG